ncbi:ammonium transporter [Klebsiella pneumoniae]|nr:ammonium transporter [Klebsiella pneumoniae]
MKMATMKSGLGALALLPGLAMAAPAVADKADNAFMMICTALVLFMTIPGIALFYGGLIRGKNVLSMLTQVIVTFGLVCVLWVIYGYTLAFGTGGSFFGSFDWVMLKNIELKALMGTFYQYIHVAFQGSFACITVGLIVGALAERIRFSAVLIFVVVWMTLSYVPIAHMVWGGRSAGDPWRAGLRRRHRCAHQRRGRRAGGRLYDGQTRGLRQRSVQTA